MYPRKGKWHAWEDPEKENRVSKGKNSVNEAGSYDPAILLLGIYLTRKHIFVYQKYGPECS